MQITDMRIRLTANPREKVKAWASIELDRCFALRDVKIIDVGDGLFLAMPCRKTCDRCPGCNGKNQNIARFCNWCGAKLAENRVPTRPDGRPDLWHDIAFPITQELREHMEEKVLDEYERLADLGNGLPHAEHPNPMNKIESRHGE